MSNGKTPSGSERREPQLSPMTNLDRIRDEAAGPSISGFSSTAARSGHSTNQVHAAHQDSVGVQPVPATHKAHSNSGVWCVVILLICGLGGAASFGYLELQRLNGMQKSMLERVNVLAATSDQLGSQLNASGGQLQQTQSSVNARVTQLEQKLLEQLAIFEASAEQGKALAADLKSQFATSVAQQSKAFEQTSATLKANVTAEMNKSLASAKAVVQDQTEVITALQQKMAVAEKSLAELSTELKQEATGFEQSLLLLKEELAIDPECLKILQNQFTTYMQSVDQFRQQTNGSLNEMNLQIQDIYRSQEETAVQPQPNENSGFGVQTVP